MRVSRFAIREGSVTSSARLALCNKYLDGCFSDDGDDDGDDEDDDGGDDDGDDDDDDDGGVHVYRCA